jgi:hypothetical protein
MKQQVISSPACVRAEAVSQTCGRRRLAAVSQTCRRMAGGDCGQVGGGGPACGRRQQRAGGWRWWRAGGRRRVVWRRRARDRCGLWRAGARLDFDIENFARV